MKISLKNIRDNAPCKSGWKRTLDNFGKTKATSAKFDLIQLIDTVGIEDAYWALCCLPYEEQLPFLLAIAEYFSKIDRDYEPNGSFVMKMLDVYRNSAIDADMLKVAISQHKKCLYTLVATPTDNLYKISRFSVGILMQDGRPVESAEKDFWIQAEKLYRQVFK